MLCIIIFGSTGGSAGLAISSSKNRRLANSKIPPPVEGRTCKEKTATEVQQKSLPMEAESERGELWKSIRDFNRMEVNDGADAVQCIACLTLVLLLKLCETVLYP